MRGEEHATYHLETTLTSPDGITEEIVVHVQRNPVDAGCLIYGWMKDGSLGCVKVAGQQQKVSLPFTQNTVYIKYLDDLDSLRVRTLAWRERRDL